MVAPYLILGLMGLGLFYFQNLVLLPHVHLRLLSLLIFAAALRPPLALGFVLAVFLGLLQDSYGLTPFGLPLSGAPTLVAAARLPRRHFLLANLGSQVVASLAALFLEEAVLRGALWLLERRAAFPEAGFMTSVVEIICTCALAPLVFAWLDGTDRLFKRLGWRPARPTL
jgi:rod shape-determining protein MreD